MGNKCYDDSKFENNILISSQDFIYFIKYVVQQYFDNPKYQNFKYEFDKLNNYVNSFKKEQFHQMLQNDHYLSLAKHKVKQFEIRNLSSFLMEDSMSIINDYKINHLQFQDLYIQLLQKNRISNDPKILRNKQFEADKEIVAELILTNIFSRLCDEKSAIYQLIVRTSFTVVLLDYEPIIDLASSILIYMYQPLKQTKIPELIFDLLMIWMVQVLVFNFTIPPTKKGKEEHLLDLIFYHRSPIEKLMILYAQDQLIRKQYIIKDADDYANRIEQILRDYKRVIQLKEQLILIRNYVKADWFITLNHIHRTWEVIANRF